jgi:hypothetical protein
MNHRLGAFGLLLAVVAVLLPDGTAVGGGSLRGYRARFRTESVSRAGDVELVQGSMIFRSPDRVRMSVYDPVHQELQGDSTGLVIYYPDRDRGFRIRSRSAGLLPSPRAFLAATLPDFGLAAEGCTLDRFESQGDTLVTRWKGPPGPLLGDHEFVLRTVGRNLVFVDHRDPSGDSITRVRFSNHRDCGDFGFPLQAEFLEGRPPVLVKLIRLSDVEIDPVLDESDLSVTIPSTASVAEETW